MKICYICNKEIAKSIINTDTAHGQCVHLEFKKLLKVILGDDKKKCEIMRDNAR